MIQHWRPSLVVVLLLLAYTSLSPGRVASSRRAPYSVGGVYQLCNMVKRGPLVGTLRVEGRYWVVPFPGGHASLGVLYDRVLPAARAFRAVVTPVPGTNAATHRMKLAKHPLVVVWPGTYAPSVAGGEGLVVRGRLFCRGLERRDSYVLSARGKPYLIGQGWASAGK